MKFRILACALGLALCAPAVTMAGTSSHTFDMSGVPSAGGGFFANFPTLIHDFGVAGTIVGVEFDLSYESFSPSWTSEAIVFVDGAFDGLGDFIVLDPADYGAPDAPGVFSYSDSLVTSIVSDGTAAITAIETFDDGSVDPDAVYLDGSYITVSFEAIPEPASAVLVLGFLAGCVALRRRMIG